MLGPELGQRSEQSLAALARFDAADRQEHEAVGRDAGIPPPRITARCVDGAESGGVHAVVNDHGVDAESDRSRARQSSLTTMIRSGSSIALRWHSIKAAV